ncbi:MAG: hypothetical protein IT384_32145 [Deltaproteobacteria bacterium]|nr:hypothetical protein [Deltaproteobacteria bacterium]
MADALKRLEGHPLVELEVASDAECRRARDEVHALRERWISRDHRAPFFTLGAASYIDAQYAPDPRHYHSLALAHNFVLRERFGWLHQRLLDRLSEALGAPAYFARKMALPGFHIFLSHSAFEERVCSVHIDLQHNLLDWDPDEAVDRESPLSFTLPVAVPASGAGLLIWNATLADDAALADPAFCRGWSLAHPPEHHRYRLGRMALHRGLSVHQIAPFQMAQPSDERITLQGHAIKSVHGWAVYW